MAKGSVDKFVNKCKNLFRGRRTEYRVVMTFQGRSMSRIVIDQHYRDRHHESIDDELILDLVQAQNGAYYFPVSTQGDFEFFKIEPVVWKLKSYRLILLVCQSEDYVGVVNAFRVETL